MSRLLPLLLCLLCSLIAAPAFAGPDRSHAAGHFLLDLGADGSYLMQEVAADPIVGQYIDKKQRSALDELLKSALGKSLTSVGDARAAAKKKKAKKLPSFSTIQSANATELEELEDWTGESLKQLEKIQKQLDSLNDLGEENLLKLQMSMQRLNQAMTALSNVMKKVHEQQQETIDNIR